MPANGQVTCASCGFLAARAKREGNYRPHAGYFEVEFEDREAPCAEFSIAPGDTNALHKGELVCFRGAADLRREITELPVAQSPNDAAREVVQKPRSCASWSRYRPGLDPPQLHTELRTEALEADRREFHTKLSQWEQQQNEREQRQSRRLTCAAIILGSIIGVCQIFVAILTMTKDSIGCGWLKTIYQLISGKP
jgi:hypothetical protein